jgi:hypothetical protein
MNPYTTYYLKQAQSGVSRGHYPSQQGKGLGNWLTSIAKTVYPYIRGGLSTVTDELITAGIGLASDKFRSIPLKESLPNRVKTLGKGLTDKAVNKVQAMTGSGTLKRKCRTATGHSTVKRRRVNKVKKTKKSKKKKKAKKKVSKKVKTKKKIKRKVATKRPKKKKCEFKDIFA